MGGGGGGGGVVGFIKGRIGVTPCFFHVYASTTKFNVIDFIRRHLKYINNVKIQEFYCSEFHLNVRENVISYS